MAKEVKSGNEIVAAFFKTMKDISGVDNDVADTLITLYNQKKFSQKNISNALQKLREKALK